MNEIPATDVTTLTPEPKWLVEFLGKETGATLPAHDPEDLNAHLKRTSFTELLQAIEVGGPNRAITVQLYQLWIAANAGASPHLFAAWFNVGIELSSAGDRANSIIANRNALALKPDFYQAAINLGLSQEALGGQAEALATWGAALQSDEARTALLNQRGRLFETLRQYDEAEKALRTSLQTIPMQPDALQHWLHLRQKMAEWPIFGRNAIDLTQDEMTFNMGPLGALAAFDEIAIQRRIAEEWLDRKTTPAPLHLSPPEGYSHDKIRLGYMSSDFCMHAMSFLVAELFERHDRDKFEVYGYCSTKEDGSEIRQRVIRSFDKFLRINDMTSEQAARAIRNDEIDILIDLNGLTLGGRFQALRWKPAPVQLTYLGYIGPVPVPELDYMLCDEYVVPRDRAEAYAPAPLHLPGVYQCNDTKLVVGPPVTRAESGLPEDKFILCCFSNHYKITEEVFGAWMTIMRRAENTVLWLAGDNQWSRDNLRAAAERQGVAADRIIFSDRVAPPQYLARLKVPDLFLDTFPYNAGTVASDVLRMGLPLVTMSGESFVSRMAGSLLTAMGLTDAIATNLDQYVEIAVGLATDKAKHAEYRAALAGDTWLKTIGNIELFTSQMEEVLLSVVKKPGGKPAAASVKPQGGKTSGKGPRRKKG